MNINEAKTLLGDYITEVTIAKSYVSRGDVIRQITELITSEKVDVDEEYINIIYNLDYANLKVDIRYVPVYQAIAIARLNWKEMEKNQSIDHQEYVRFSTLFYADNTNKNHRINNLNILKVINKKNNNFEETKVNDLEQSSGSSLILRNENCSLLPSVVLDVPLENNQMYPMETSYVMSKQDIDSRVQKAFENTKTYAKFSKKSEKWSNIEKIEIEATLVPVARIKIGDYYQYINCANGVIDVQYERNKEITKNVNTARWLYIPSLITFIGLGISSFFTKMKRPMTFKNGVKFFFGNFADVTWLILIAFGIIFSLFAIPTRNEIVKRATKKKDRLKKCRIFTRLLIDVCLCLIILILMCI